MFASNEYNLALMQGSNLSSEDKKKISNQLARLSGLSEDFVERADLRINPYRYTKELLWGTNEQIGRFDLRFRGLALESCSNFYDYDPSFERVAGAFNATFNNYVRDELNWKIDEKYQVIADVQPWNYGSSRTALDLSSDIRETMIKNPSLKIFVGSGFYDFATPYYATIYTFNHLGLPAPLSKNIQMNFYKSGHLMYLFPEHLVQLKNDLSYFYKKTLEALPNPTSDLKKQL